MRTNRFVLWLGLLVVATFSVGALAFLLLRREGGKMRENAEQSRLMANEATSRAKLYHEMAKQSRSMAEYAEMAAEDSLAFRTRTVADNLDLIMAELKEGLMSGLRTLQVTNRAENLSSWSSSNNWVDKCFVWGAKEGLSFPADKKPGDPSPLRYGERWVWERDKASVSVQEESDQVQRQTPEQTGKEVGPSAFLEQKNDLQVARERVAQGKAEQQEALAALELQQKNALALRSNILENNQEEGQIDQVQGSLQSEQKTYGKVQSFLSQKVPVAQQQSSAWAIADNYSSSKLNRKQLRLETRNEAFPLGQSPSLGKDEADAKADGFTPREGWEYVKTNEGFAWYGWRQENPERIHGLKLESSEVLKSLQSAFPKNLVEGESFALRNSANEVVFRSGEHSPETERVAKASIPVGTELPGWKLDARLALPTAVILPPTELPDESLLMKEFLSASSLDGEWGGYVAFSSVIAIILVAALLLGGSVLLIQVRRNSLEAVRKTTFVSNVSHELKTPLTTIRMYGEMLGDGIVKDEGKKKGYLETIISESQRLTRLVNNVLDFGRLERGEKTYDVRDTQVGSVVTEVLDTQRLRLEGAGLEVDCRDDSKGASAKLDPDALEQVLLNLLDNLVKYAAEGKHAGVHVSADTNGVCLEVTDRGPGIPSGHLERIFDTFHRVDDSLTANKPGCGIGLGIARKLVEDMGGNIVCKANHPQGANFRITFPRTN